MALRLAVQSGDIQQMRTAVMALSPAEQERSFLLDRVHYLRRHDPKNVAPFLETLLALPDLSPELLLGIVASWQRDGENRQEAVKGL